MERNELVLFVGKQVERLKMQEVGDKIEKGDAKKLAEILATIDYAPFKKERQPLFNEDELELEDPESIRCLAFYVWGNPYVEGGDFSFFGTDATRKFWQKLEEKCGLWGQRLNLLLVGYHVLSQNPWDNFSGLTLDEFLHPETVEEVTVKDINLDELTPIDDYLWEED